MGNYVIRIFKASKTSQVFMTIVLQCNHSSNRTGGELSDSTTHNQLTDGRLLQPLQFASGRS